MVSTGLVITDEAGLAAPAAALAAALRPGDTIALSGDLGAGKTTLARAILRALGWAGDVPSPTYTLVQPYDLPRLAVWHVDLYRLESPDDADALGLFETDAVLLIEWPERLGARLPADALRLHLAGSGEAPRHLTWALPAAWEGRWPASFPNPS
ncbi:tRNA threonylcarbamoyladenosine biosynthesis protein TsaE [alpha proteobacterium AAP81b]|nr:tRNA threonylcarbamoyladenosine biosynthesis protein TsaE [alpha proteobacterium AAP81b]